MGVSVTRSTQQNKNYRTSVHKYLYEQEKTLQTRVSSIGPQANLCPLGSAALRDATKNGQVLVSKFFKSCESSGNGIRLR